MKTKTLSPDATLNEKNEQAMELVAEIKGLIAEGVAPVSEQIVELKAKHQEAVDAVRADLEKAMEAFSVPGSGEHREGGEGYSMLKAMRVVQTGDESLGPVECAMNKEIHEKAMSFGVDTSGGFLVPAEITGEIIELLYAESVAAKLGATKLDNLNSAPVPIPRVASGTTAYWGGEASTITASDLSIEQMLLNPNDLFALTVLSEKLLRLGGNASIEGMIRSDMATALALKIDKAVLAGTGASGEPIGILNASGVNTAVGHSDPPTYNQYVDFISKVREDNALRGSLGWAMGNAEMYELETIEDTPKIPASVDGTYVSQQHERRRLLSEDGTKVLGYPAEVSTQLGANEIIFGNWKDAIIAQWGPLQLAMTNAVGFTTAQTHLRALTWADVGIRHAASFCIP